MALASSEAANPKDLQREAVRGLFIKKGLIYPLDDQKKYLKDHGDRSAAVDFGIIRDGDKSLSVGALRWGIEPLREDKDTDIWRSKAVRVTFDPETDEAKVSYVAEEDTEDGKKLEWREIGSSKSLDDRIKDAVILANGKTFEDRRIGTGSLPSGYPGIGRNTF